MKPPRLPLPFPSTSWPGRVLRRARSVPRRWWALVAAVLVLGGFAADRTAEALVTRQLADRLACQAGVSGDVALDVGGVSFIAQALTGRYTSVRVKIKDLRMRGLRADLDVQAEGVRLPDARQLASGFPTGAFPEATVGIERGQAAVTLPWDALNAMLAERGADGQSQTSQEGPSSVGFTAVDGRLAIDAVVPMLGQQVPLTILADPAIDGNAVRVEPASVVVQGMEVPIEMLRQLGGMGDQPGRDARDDPTQMLEGMTLPLPELPAEVALTGVEASDEGLVVRADIAAFETALGSGTRGQAPPDRSC
jgi:hypothetical protein